MNRKNLFDEHKINEMKIKKKKNTKFKNQTIK